MLRLAETQTVTWEWEGGLCLKFWKIQTQHGMLNVADAAHTVLLQEVGRQELRWRLGATQHVAS